MSSATSPNQIEFIRLNGLTVRVTSWRAGSAPGTFTLVTITRGSRDAGTLDDLFKEPRLTLDLGDQDVRSVIVADIDRRTVGEGQAGITRYAVTLAAAEPGVERDAAATQPTPSLEERVARLETEVQRLRELLLGHANGIRH